MAFLRGHVSTQQLIDLAAYIADPASATGQPVAQVSPTALSFGAAPAPLHRRSRSPSPTPAPLPLAMSGVSSSDPSFAVNSSCSVVAINASCRQRHRTPSATGARNATITILHNASGGGSTVTASGSGSAAAIQVPATLVFPPTVVGSSTSAVH